MTRSTAFLALFVAGCTAGTSSNQTGSALHADQTARSFGVSTYVAAADRVTLFDRDGVELGRIEISAPADDRRVFSIATTDGFVDDVEVYRPISDGRFVAPIERDTLLGAALADRTLAGVWAAHDVLFRARDGRQGMGAADVLAPSTLATTTSCTTASSDTPAGCARPANTSLGCTNPSQLPAAITLDTGVYAVDLSYWGYDEAGCRASAPSECAAVYGPGLWGEVSQTAYCAWGEGGYWVYCRVRDTANRWDSSCPRSSCGTAGQYDRVPRLRYCYEPGSCTKSQGAISCTPYH